MQKQEKFISGDLKLYQNWIIKRQRVVGKGNSIVYEVQDDQKNIECIKEIKLETKDDQIIFRKEVQLLSKLMKQPHPHIIEFKGSYCLEEKKNQHKKRKGYIQMEKGITSLKQFIRHRKEKKEYFSQEDVLEFFTSMLDAFAHLQRCQLAHRDVKPSNILIFSLDPLFFKICDVGAGTAVGVCERTQNRTVIGTPHYLSPELFIAYRQKQNDTIHNVFKSDSYSLGLVFLQFLTLQKIDERLCNEAQKIKKAIQFCKKQYQGIVGIGKVLRKMLDENIKTRMDFMELEVYIAENQLLRNKINSDIELSPQLLSKLSSQKQFFIEKFEDMSHLNKIANTGNTAPNIKIQLNSSNGFMKKNEKNYLEELKNLKHVSLEEVLLKIEMCGLDAEDAEYIYHAIYENKSIRIINLNLWNNEIKSEGCIKILQAIQSIIYNLQQLSINFSSNKIKFSSIFKNLFKLEKATKLKKLSLQIGFNDIDAEYFQIFLRQISQAVNLEHLVLDFQKMNLSYVHFSRAIKELQSLKNIKIFALNVSTNEIRDQGMFGISDILESFENLTEVSILFRNSNFGDKGFGEFLKSISNNLKHLKKIKLNLLGNKITEKGVKQGFSTMENLKEVTNIDLNISHSKIQDYGVKWLGQNLGKMKQLQTIRLVLDFSYVTQKGCFYIARMISQADKLINLQLSLKQNKIELKGIQYICQGLLRSKKVRKLKIVLDGTKIGDYAANYLAKCLLKMRHLSSVDLSMQNCDLNEATMENITKLARECTNKAEQITISMRKNGEIRQQLYQEIKKQLNNSRFAIRVDNPSTLQYSKSS